MGGIGQITVHGRPRGAGLKVENFGPGDTVAAELRRVAVIGDLHDMSMNVRTMVWEKMRLRVVTIDRLTRSPAEVASQRVDAS